MSNPILSQGEVIVRKTGGMEYVGVGRISAWLTLTNHRIIIQRMLRDPVDYPLSHVTHVGAYEHWSTPLTLIPHKLLRLDFDNGGAIFFGLTGLSDWIQIIEQTRVNASRMPFTTMPEPPQAFKSFSSVAPKLRWVVFALMAASFGALCILPSIWILLNLFSK